MAQTLTAQEDYCREKAAPDGSNFYYASLFETDELKSRLFPVFALHYEIIDCLTASPDPGVTRLKLHWWLEEIERLFQKQPRHPITTRLLPIISGSDINSDTFLAYMAVAESIVSGQAPPRLSDWFTSLSNGLGKIWSVAVKLSASPDTSTVALATRNGGIIFTLDLLQNLNILASRGYNFLPAELLEKHRISADNLTINTGKEPIRELSRTLTTEIRHQLDDCYQKATSKSPQLPLYHLIMNRIARVVTVEIENDGHRLLSHRIALTPIRKLWIAYRTRMFR